MSHGSVSDVQEYSPSAAEFGLSITKALRDQLSDAIAGLAPAPLDFAELRKLEIGPGVYQLFRGGILAYIGRTEKSLPERLNHRLRNFSGRQNISLSEMFFTCLYVAEHLSAVAPDTLMIRRHKGEGTALWNTKLGVSTHHS